MPRLGRSKQTGRTERKPDGQVRQSQLLSTYGAGAMIDLVQHAVLVQGLDAWNYHGTERDEDIFVHEPRLKDRLQETHKIRLDDESYFRRPPAGKDDDPNPGLGIRVLEFPANFVCQACRRLIHRRDLGDSVTADGRRYHALCEAKSKDGRGKGSTVVPVRFVGACRKGHLQDFPWSFFVHFGPKETRCNDGVLFFREGVSGDFNEIEVACSCGAYKRLAEARSDDLLITCDGRMPWLPPESDTAKCGDKLHLLVRTASNGYFSLQMSALSVEEPDHIIRDALSGHEVMIRTAAEKSPEYLRMFLEVGHDALVKKHGMDAVLEQARSLADGTPVARGGIRSGEYLQLTIHAERGAADAPVDEEKTFVARRIDATIPKVSTVTLVHRLREVIVQFGFTRLEPSSADLQGEVDLGVSRAKLGAVEDWLPAATLQGEGVFFELDAAALDAWGKRPAVLRRQEDLHAGWIKWHEDRSRQGSAKKVPPFLGMRFYLLHSLSHLLINSIAMECGYSASAIKERIYCGPLDLLAGGGSAPSPRGSEFRGAPLPPPRLRRDTAPNSGAREMAGILLYTGTVGSEGTLGGLVQQGARLGHHLRRALQIGQLCSNDPICGAHTPKGDPTDRLLEGAACHGCLLIAEPSCDNRFNRTLDRALVIPVIGQEPELAFFDREDFE